MSLAFDTKKNKRILNKVEILDSQQWSNTVLRATKYDLQMDRLTNTWTNRFQRGNSDLGEQTNKRMNEVFFYLKSVK